VCRRRAGQPRGVRREKRATSLRSTMTTIPLSRIGSRPQDPPGAGALVAGEASLDQIAHDAGYQDRTGFLRAFRRVMAAVRPNSGLLFIRTIWLSGSD
jgi:AraC-like DNA-binding protein